MKKKQGRRIEGVYSRLTPRIQHERAVLARPQGLSLVLANLLVPWQAENSVFNSRHGSALLLGR